MLSYLFGSSTRPPVGLKFRSSDAFITVTVAAAVFTDIFVYGIIVPVLPFALQQRSAVDTDDIQRWISIFLAVYGAALLVAAPFCGWIADRLESRRWPMLAGLLLLGGSTVMLCVGNSLALLIAGRVMQGMSAAVVWVVGLALLVDTVGSNNIGIAMGYVTIALSLAVLLAPLLGGIVFARADYYAVFAMAFGLIAVDMFLRIAIIEKKVARKFWNANPELQNSDSEALSATSPTKLSLDEKAVDLAHSDADVEKGDVSLGQRTLSQTDASVLATPAAAAEPAKSPFKRFINRLPPLLFLLTSRRILSFMFVCTIQASLLTAFDALLPLYVHDIFGWDSIGAGVIFVAVVLPTFASPLIGKWTDKHGSRWPATLGFIFSAPFYIMLRLVNHNTIDQKVLLCALLALVGLGLTLALTPMIAEVIYAVDAKAMKQPPGFFGRNGAYAQAFGLFNMAWAAGCFVGPLLGGLVSEAHGWAAATLLLGCLSAFTAIPAAIWTSGSIFEKMRARKESKMGSI